MLPRACARARIGALERLPTAGGRSAFRPARFVRASRTSLPRLLGDRTMMMQIDRGLSDEQKMMRETCRAFVNDFVTPFLRQHWQQEWNMKPDERLPPAILE